MREAGADVSRRVVRQLLKKHKYIKRKSQKQIAGGNGVNRNEQFENIAQKCLFLKARCACCINGYEEKGVNRQVFSW